MKKSILLSPVLFFLLFMSCTKDEDLTLISNITHKLNFQEIVLNEENPEKKEANALVLESFEDIVNAFENNDITIDDLTSLDPRKMQQGIFISKAFMDLDSNIAKLKSTAEKKVMINNTMSSPGLLFYNIDNCDKNKSPIIALGVELGEEYEDSTTNGKDQIAGIVLNNGQRDTIIISETFANSTDNPLLIISSHSDNIHVSQEMMDAAKKETFESEPRLKTEITVYPCYRIFQTCRLDERFDKSTRSEFNITYTSYPEEGFDDAEFRLNGINLELIDLHKDYIGVVVPLYEEIQVLLKKEWIFGDYINVEKWDHNVIIMGMTYERDWYASYKDHTITVRGRNFTFRGRMSYSDEYYQLINAYLPEYYPCSLYTPLDHNGVYIGESGVLTIRGVVLGSCN